MVLFNSLGQGSRFDGFKAYSSNLTKMIKNLKSNLKSVQYYFTKYEDEEGA